MKITFYAHAWFRPKAGKIPVVTDPYTPGPEVSNFDPVGEPEDSELSLTAAKLPEKLHIHVLEQSR